MAVPPIEPALGLLELESIAAGIEVGDAMAKRAPIELIRAGTVHPGKFLVLVGGDVADVEEALDAGRELGGLSVRDVTFLPNIHPDVVDGLRGMRRAAQDEALGPSHEPAASATDPQALGACARVRHEEAAGQGSEARGDAQHRPSGGV